MILGRGPARTAKNIIAEYYRFLDKTDDIGNRTIRARLKDAPGTMQRRVKKPLTQWTDDDILGLYRNRTKTVRYAYSAFLAFLFFRGYRQASLRLVTELSLNLTRYHRAALLPFRRKLEEIQQKLGYDVQARVGSELTLLITLLAVVHKPLNELTRLDFDSFQDQYQDWYRKTRRQKNGRPNSRLTRLEFYLVQLGQLPPAHHVLRHEEHFAQVRSEHIRAAILAFLEWYGARCRPSTIYSRRAALFNFFLWFQDHFPQRERLDDVTRPIALAYASHLKAKRESGQYSLIYCIDLYRSLRLFYEFTIRENLETSPHRNSFADTDLPRKADPVPRYLSDHQVHRILAYCEDKGSLKERTLVTLLLHTGIRAAELAALQVSDIVQIQGKWKLHIHEGKGLKDRVIPLTAQCLTVLQTWQDQGWEHINDSLFTRFGRPWHSATVSTLIRDMGLKLELEGVTPHRFRHTFAVALLNYGMRESALQKLMGHSTLNMTLEYARVLDRTVETAFASAVDQMRTGPISWVPSFFAAEEYSMFAEADALSWIRLPLGYCRRSPQLHCECDVKCLLCDRFVAPTSDMPRLQEMQARFQLLGMQLQAEVVATQIHRLEAQPEDSFISGNTLRLGVTPPNVHD